MAEIIKVEPVDDTHEIVYRKYTRIQNGKQRVQIQKQVRTVGGTRGRPPMNDVARAEKALNKSIKKVLEERKTITRREIGRELHNLNLNQLNEVLAIVQGL